MQYPKCKTCKHSKSSHGAVYLGGFCEDCYNFALNGPNFDFEWDIEVEKFNYCYHYIPDNLAFVEKLAERKRLV